jgi:tyrosyl-tRNA synthetase
MLVREVFPKMKWKVPVAVHQHLIPGLTNIGGATDTTFTKMSKSNPKNSIFIHDSEKEITSKIKIAWCPEGISDNNPILEYCKYLVFRDSDSFTIERPSKFGGDMMFSTYEELESEYKNGKIHPLDLKLSVGRELNDIISPIRAYFSNKSELFSSI